MFGLVGALMSINRNIMECKQKCGEVDTERDFVLIET